MLFRKVHEYFLNAVIKVFFNFLKKFKHIFKVFLKILTILINFLKT